MGIQDLVQLYITEVARDDLGLRLKGTYYLAQALQFLWAHLTCLIEQHDVAELYLLNHQILYVFLFDVLLQEIQSACKLIFHAQGIYHGDDAVESWKAVGRILWHELRDGADGLCDGGRFADAAGLYHDVVEALHAHDVMQLLHEIHLQSAADAAVLQSHEAVVFLPHYTTFLYEIGIYIYFTYIIDYHGELDAAFIGQNSVEQCGFSTAQIACEQKYRRLHFHLYFHISLFTDAKVRNKLRIEN